MDLIPGNGASPSDARSALDASAPPLCEPAENAVPPGPPTVVLGTGEFPPRPLLLLSTALKLGSLVPIPVLRSVPPANSAPPPKPPAPPVGALLGLLSPPARPPRAASPPPPPRSASPKPPPIPTASIRS